MDEHLRNTKSLTTRNNQFKKTLEAISIKLKEIEQIKNDLLILDDKLVHFDTIDMLYTNISLLKETNEENLISILKSLKNSFEFFNQTNNFDYLEKTKKIEKIVKIQCFNKITASFIKNGDAFCYDLKNKTILNLLGLELETFFKKKYFNKRQTIFYKKIKDVPNLNDETVIWLIENEIQLQEKLFGVFEDSFLFEVLNYYFQKFSKLELKEKLSFKNEDLPSKVFRKCLVFYFEENYEKLEENEVVYDI